MTIRAPHPGQRTDLRAWALAWLGGPVIGIANGVVRRAVYQKPLGELRAHQVSTMTAAGLLGTYVQVVDRRWPIATGRDAVLVGGAWAGLTAAFEFGFGHYVGGAPWRVLLRDYDVSQGRVWGLVLLTLAAAPAAARTARLRRGVARGARKNGPLTWGPSALHGCRADIDTEGVRAEGVQRSGHHIAADNGLVDIRQLPEQGGAVRGTSPRAYMRGSTPRPAPEESLHRPASRVPCPPQLTPVTSRPAALWSTPGPGR